MSRQKYFSTQDLGGGEPDAELEMERDLQDREPNHIDVSGDVWEDPRDIVSSDRLEMERDSQEIESNYDDTSEDVWGVLRDAGSSELYERSGMERDSQERERERESSILASPRCMPETGRIRKFRLGKSLTI